MNGRRISADSDTSARPRLDRSPRCRVIRRESPRGAAAFTLRLCFNPRTERSLRNGLPTEPREPTGTAGARSGIPAQPTRMSLEVGSVSPAEACRFQDSVRLLYSRIRATEIHGDVRTDATSAGVDGLREADRPRRLPKRIFPLVGEV